MAHRHDVALADEDVRLAERDRAVDHLRGAGDDEQRVAILLDLGILVRLAGVLDGELVQVQLRLHATQQVERGLAQADPDDAAVLARPGAGLFDRDVAKPAALRVDAGGDQSPVRGALADEGVNVSILLERNALGLEFQGGDENKAKL